MKVIFLHDVAKIGKKHQMKNVSDGYAVNFLIPNKHAILATPEAVKNAENLKIKAEAEKKIQDSLLHKNIETATESRLKIVAKVNDKGHLFSGIHKEQIASELKSQFGVELPSELIQLDKPIKEVGEHKVKIGIPGEKDSILVVEISAQ